jgi:hypothetical protein
MSEPTESYQRAQASYDKQEQPEPVDEDAALERYLDEADRIFEMMRQDNL